MLPRTAPPPAWPAFLVSALLATTILGALFGAIDLWHAQAELRGVSIDHHQSHAFAQAFGFLQVFIIGVGFHLAPRFFASSPPSPGRVALTRWLVLPGVWLLMAGRLGALLPGSAWLGLAGAVLFFAGVTLWAGAITRLGGAAPPKETLRPFVIAGTLWWWLAALLVLLWEVGQVYESRLTAVPLEAAYGAALWGGAASWLWGIFQRAGVSALRMSRPSPESQRRGFVVWQPAVALYVMACFFVTPWLRGVASLGLAVAMALVLAMARPFHRVAGGEGEPLSRLAIQLGFGFGAVFALLSAWSGLAALGVVPGRPYLFDATRHAFTLGCLMLLVVGFSARMVPAFEGVPLPWKGAYDAGVLAIAAGALGRMAVLASPLHLARAVAGASGAVAFCGVACFSACLFAAMWRGRRARRG